MMTSSRGSFAVSVWAGFVVLGGASPIGAVEEGDAVRRAFLVTGDPQYLAEKSDTPTRLDPFSEEANARFIALLKGFAGEVIPEAQGGGRVADELLGVLVVGDLIDSADKTGGPHPAMQRFEWDRYRADYGLTGNDGGLPMPVYELHGNHDGPQGDTFVVEGVIERNRRRPGVVHVSPNGLHYSWDWGPLHLVNLGIFVGEGEARRGDHHYAPRSSLEFLRDDLAKHVGDSGRPVVISFHLHPNGPEFDWPAEDLASFWKAIESFNVVALFHGHTHGSPPSRLRWDGASFGPELAGGIDVFNPDDSGAAKTDPRQPGTGIGLNHGFLYVELVDRPGDGNDEFVVRSIATKDNWATHRWDRTWRRPVRLPGDTPAGSGEGETTTPPRDVEDLSARLDPRAAPLVVEAVRVEIKPRRASGGPGC